MVIICTAMDRRTISSKTHRCCHYKNHFNHSFFFRSSGLASIQLHCWKHNTFFSLLIHCAYATSFYVSKFTFFLCVTVFFSLFIFTFIMVLFGFFLCFYFHAFWFPAKFDFRFKKLSWSYCGFMFLFLFLFLISLI